VEEKLVFAPWVASVAPALLANFYASKDVLMPFAFGRGAVDGYQVWQAWRGFRYFGPPEASATPFNRAQPATMQREHD
jgi:hypothetical protein